MYNNNEDDKIILYADLSKNPFTHLPENEPIPNKTLHRMNELATQKNTKDKDATPPKDFYIPPKNNHGA